jgi:DNA transformation protein
MAYDRGLIDWAAEAMAPVGEVTHRPMMGAAVLYCDGAVFAVVDEDSIWFKADRVSDAEWDALACPRFTFEGKDGEVGSLNYRRAPDGVYDDADEFRQLAALGLAAGRRNPPKRKPAKPSPAGRTSRS